MIDPRCDAVRARLEALADRVHHELDPAVVPASFRRAAVLFLVWCQDGEAWTVLMRRPATLRSHAGQIALPGGRLDPGETAEEAARRETFEEIGVPPERITMLGRLDDAWSGAGSVLVPFVGWLDDPARSHREPPTFEPNPGEVDHLIVAPLRALAEPAAHRVEPVTFADRVFHNDVIGYDGHDIWGLTADLVLEVLAWLGGVDPARGPERQRELGIFATFDDLRWD